MNELCGRIDQLSPAEAAAQILVSPLALETARLESQDQQFFFSAFDHSDCLLSVNLPTQSILSGLSFFQQHTYALSLIYLAVIPILLIYIGFLLLRPLHILFFLPAMPTSTISMKRFIWTAGITSFFLHRRKVSGRLS